MKPAPFDYVRAEDMDHALELLEEHGDEAKVIAGGQSLIPLLNLRLARPGVVIDLNDLLSLGILDVHDDELVTGALVRHRTLCDDPMVSEANAMLSAAARFIGHPAIRNRGTMGGSMAHADPAAELPLLAVACGAMICTSSIDAEREVAAEDFFAGPFTTALSSTEIIRGVRWPILGQGDIWGYSQIAERSGDFAEAAAGVVVLRGRPRVVVAGVPGSPLRLPQVEAWLASAPSDPEEAREVTLEALRATLGAPDLDDRHSRDLVAEMVVRAVRQAWSRRSTG